jgi:dihydroorotate dehydrogenase
MFGLTFPNELGVAAGFDKNAEAIAGLGALGFGHIEVGTLTPRPQAGNRKPRIFRLTEDQALINRMGFPNHGAAAAVARIEASRSWRGRMVVGVSLGKQKATALAAAAQDYRRVMELVYRQADYLVVNVSSPNTPGLRNLQGQDYLAQLLKTLSDDNEALAARFQSGVRPLLLKIAPDLSWPEVDSILDAAQAHGVAGIVACNTTTSREGLRGAARDEAGGLSGAPLRERSTEIIRFIWRQSGGQMPIIGAGGVMTVDDVGQKLDAGAGLIQIYTGLIYGGPAIAGRILRGL